MGLSAVKCLEEFDAGILSEEMTRMGLTELAATWQDIVRDGICTMDPSNTTVMF